MKTIYELVYITSDKFEHNVLFADKDHAENCLSTSYFEGANIGGVIVLRSFVIERILF